jgi:hypothetical protein
MMQMFATDPNIVDQGTMHCINFNVLDGTEFIAHYFYQLYFMAFESMFIVVCMYVFCDYFAKRNHLFVLLFLGISFISCNATEKKMFTEEDISKFDELCQKTDPVSINSEIIAELADHDSGYLFQTYDGTAAFVNFEHGQSKNTLKQISNFSYGFEYSEFLVEKDSQHQKLVFSADDRSPILCGQILAKNQRYYLEEWEFQSKGTKIPKKFFKNLQTNFEQFKVRGKIDVGKAWHYIITEETKEFTLENKDLNTQIEQLNSENIAFAEKTKKLNSEIEKLSSLNTTNCHLTLENQRLEGENNSRYIINIVLCVLMLILILIIIFLLLQNKKHQNVIQTQKEVIRNQTDVIHNQAEKIDYQKEVIRNQHSSTTSQQDTAKQPTTHPDAIQILPLNKTDSDPTGPSTNPDSPRRSKVSMANGRSDEMYRPVSLPENRYHTVTPPDMKQTVSNIKRQKKKKKKKKKKTKEDSTQNQSNASLPDSANVKSAKKHEPNVSSAEENDATAASTKIDDEKVAPAEEDIENATSTKRDDEKVSSAEEHDADVVSAKESTQHAHKS